MRQTLKDVFNADAFVGYVEAKSPDFVEAYELEKLFPTQRISGLTYSYLKTANGAVELTAPSAFDAEPITQHRKGFDAMKGELPLWRRKMDLSEKERQELMILLDGNNDEAVKNLLRQIYDDQMALISGAKMTMEFLRSRVLMDGKINIASKGGVVSVDYKVPADNKYTLNLANTWDTPEADIVGQIQGWLDTVEDKTGVRPDAMVLNRKTFRYLRANKQIKSMILPAGALGQPISNSMVITDAKIIEVLKALTGLNEIMVYNKKVSMDGVLYDLIEDNKVAIYPSSVKLGNTLLGISPAEFNAQYVANAGNDIAITPEGIAVNMIVNDKAPYTAETQVEFIGLPSFLASDLVVQATVKS